MRSISKSAKSLWPFYSGMNVCVIGGCGFIGHHLTRYLLDLGANVTVIDNLSRGENIPGNISLFTEDAGEDPVKLSLIFEKKHIQVVFNLAAVVAGVLHNQKNHIQMYCDNVRVLSVPVWAAQMSTTVSWFLQTSSVCIYPDGKNSPALEVNGFLGDPVAANAGYSEAKRDGERVLEWATIPGKVIVRPSNVAGGPGDYYDDLAHVIPAFVARALACKESGEPFKLYGDVSFKREFIHPADVATGMLFAVAKVGREGAHNIYNIGTSGSTSISMGDLAMKILKKCDVRGFPDIVVDSSVGGGDHDRWSSASRLFGLGWRPEFDIDDIIDDAISGYGLWLSKYGDTRSGSDIG